MSTNVTEVRNDIVVSSVQSRNTKFLSLSKDGSVEDFIRECKNDSRFFQEKDEDGNGVLYQAVRRNSVALCEVLYRKDMNLFLSENKELLDAFKETLRLDQTEVREWLYENAPGIFRYKDQNNDVCITWICREGLKPALRWYLEKEPYGVHGSDFLIVCASGDLESAQIIHEKNKSIFLLQDRLEQTPLLTALQSPRGFRVVKWLLTEVQVCIENEEEIELLAPAIRLLDELVLYNLIMRTPNVFYFIPHIKAIREVLKSVKTQMAIIVILQGLPKGFDYNTQTQDPQDPFLKEMKAFYKNKIEHKVNGYLEKVTVEEGSVLQRFLGEENIPYGIKTTNSDSTDKRKALKGIREHLLHIVTLDSDISQMSDEDNYGLTKKMFLEKFHREVNSVDFMYQELRNFLSQNLNGEDSSRFLIALRIWLKEQDILEEDVLKVESLTVTASSPVSSREVLEGVLVYKIKAEGVYKILKKMPNIIQLESSF
jgi:hypothetical protein